MSHLNFKKRFASVLALVLMFSLTLGACSPETQPGEDPITPQPGDDTTGSITVLYLDDPPFWKEQADRFTDATGIQVNWVGVPFGQLHTNMLTTFAGGGAVYDVIHVRDDYIAEFGSRGFLLPLDDYITQEFMETMPNRAWENLMWEGHNYGVPRYFWMWQFYYNTEIFENAGINTPPRTWGELAEVANELTKDTTGDGNIDQYGYCAAYGENLVSHPFQLRLLAAGGEVFDESGMPAFNSDAGRRALGMMVEMANSGNLCPAAYELQHSGTLAELFAQGGIAMIANSTQTYRLAENPEASRVVGKINAALAPGDVIGSATFSETGGLAIPATSENPDLAWEYIKFVTSFDEQKRMALALSSIPTSTEALTDPEVQAQFPHFAFVQEQMEYPFGMIKHPNATEVTRILAIHIVAALRGVESVEEALQKAEQEVLAITR